MIGDNTILTIFQNYFGLTIIGILFFICSIYFLLSNQKNIKTYLLGILLAILFVFNDFSRIIIGFMGEQKTYYRFLWILPVTPIIAYTFTDILFKYKHWYHKLIIIIGVCSLFMVMPITQPHTRQSYVPAEQFVSDDIIQICDIINNDYTVTTDSPVEIMLDKRVAVPYELEMRLRMYDVSLSYGISRPAYLHFNENGYYSGEEIYATEEIVALTIGHGLPPEDPAELRECIEDLKIKYLVAPSKLNLDAYLYNISCYPIGWSNHYTIYRVY